MKFDVLTIFPSLIEGFLDEGLLLKARRRNLIDVGIWDLRDFADSPDGQVDDRPYGGGPGMVMKPEPFFRGVEAIKAGRSGGRVVMLTSRGELLEQNRLEKWSKEENLILLCGRYEGIDERVGEICDERVSLGNFVLSGGEIPAAAVIEGVSRMVDGVVGNSDSVETDSFYESSSLGPPQYTRPGEYRGMEVPEVLLSGDHQKIEDFRENEAERSTKEFRPDLLGEEESDG